MLLTVADALQIFTFFSMALTGMAKQMPKNGTVRNPLSDWIEDRFLDCLFCMDYDDYERIHIFGCRLQRTPTCRGNVCYMRQHKSPVYFLYTSGCLNLTRSQYEGMTQLVSSQMPDREFKNATQLCEVASAINTCLCVNEHTCNNVSVQDPFTEYVTPIFRETNFDEIAHFRYFLPNDPVLENIRQTGTRDEYFLIKSVSNYSNDRFFRLFRFLEVFVLIALKII